VHQNINNPCKNRYVTCKKEWYGLKDLGGKNCEIKGGSPEIIEMVLMTINFCSLAVLHRFFLHCTKDLNARLH